jgi:hypothetical protein
MTACIWPTLQLVFWAWCRTNTLEEIINGFETKSDAQLSVEFPQWMPRDFWVTFQFQISINFVHFALRHIRAHFLVCAASYPNAARWKSPKE